MAFLLFPIQTKLARLVSLYARVRNLQYECRSYRDSEVISKNQNKMTVTYYNIDLSAMSICSQVVKIDNYLCI